MDLETLLTTRIAVDDIKGTDAKAAFLEIAGAMVAAGLVPAGQLAGICDAYCERERRGTTALGSGMAIPHIFASCVSVPHLVVGRSSAGVEMGAADGRPVRVMLCLIAPESARAEHLKILGAVARVARDKDWRRWLEKATSGAQVFDLLLRGEKEIAR